MPATSCNGTCPDSRCESSEAQGRRLTYPYATLFHVYVSSFRDASIREQIRGKKAAIAYQCAYTRCTPKPFANQVGAAVSDAIPWIAHTAGGEGLIGNKEGV